MPLDAICLQAVTDELNNEITGLRIEKIQQSSRDQVILLLRGSKRLLLNAGSGQPRIQLTEIQRENPAAPPMFCMLLRKHLSGGRIVSLTQQPFERVVTMDIDVIDELGQSGRRRLILETIGRKANLILTDGTGCIIDCLRRVGGDLSDERQILPGLFYRLPTSPAKRDLTAVDAEEFFYLLSAAGEEAKLDSFLLDTFMGFSPLIARELVYRVTGETDTRACMLDKAGKNRLWEELCALRLRVESGDFVPYLLEREGKPADFSFMPLFQYGQSAAGKEYPSFSKLFDEFYSRKERLERTRQRGQELIRVATTARDRAARKLALQEKEYAQTLKRDELRVFGDLITANLYRMEKGAKALVTDNFYAEDCGEITVPLDPLLTPQQNAARYYKQYNKAKTAEKVLTEQMEKGRAEHTYLESILVEIADAETEQDFIEIRAELREAGYIKGSDKGRKEQKRASRPREFVTSGGFTVLVGRNNKENDRLTLKEADKRDIWFHAQKIHGSHVILRTAGAQAGEEDIREAAMLAAWYSQGKESGNVPVDYVAVKAVKKPAGGKPGMVIYDGYRTVYATPKEELVLKLQKKK